MHDVACSWVLLAHLFFKKEKILVGN